jgi:uncharacterized protein YbjT (DUF2867 family)
MQTVLVIGSTGNIGKEIVSALSRRGGCQVLAAGRDARKVEAQLQGMPHVKGAELDLDRPETVAKGLAGVDTLVQVSPLSPKMAEQTRSLVAAARQAGVARIVRCSLMGAGEPDPIAEAQWHGDADRVIQDSGLRYTLLRPNQYFQNFISARATGTVRSQGAIYLPLADARVSNIDTRDLGEAAARVVLEGNGAHDGKAYVLTGAEACSMTQFADALAAELGKPVKYVPVGEDKFRQGLAAAGVPQIVAEAILGWFGYCRAGRAERVSPDLERLLGHKPRTAVDFVRDHAGLYR